MVEHYFFWRRKRDKVVIANAKTLSHDDKKFFYSFS